MSLLSRIAVQAARAYGILSSDKNRVVADFLVVAGGGGGGANSNSGGGGAGGMLTSTATLSTLNTYSITVGAGGNGATSAGTSGSQGANSVISGTGLSTITAIGGGYGGHPAATGGSGGSGGGNGYSVTTSGGTGTAGQGNNGGSGAGESTSPAYSAGGGGGAGAAGGNGTSTVGSGVGGAGLASSISGSSVTYAGGGGAGNDTTTVQAGGSGGGGAGGSDNNNAAVAGTTNTGGGGGGSSTLGNGGSGGSGIVIISYTSATPLFVGGTLTTSGGNQIHTFTSSGTLSPITPITASYLVVAGGGGGAGHGGAVRGGGGGGAGGYLESTTTLYSGATYIVTVGAGGTGAGDDTSTNGSNSVLSGTGLTTLTSVGGGAGKLTANGATGGSGGGGGYTTNTGGAGTSGQGYAGGNGGTVTGSASDAGGGGGGAGGIGGNGSSSGGGTGGTGGAGVASSITGTSISRAGGGGGGNGNGNGGTATAGGGTGGSTGSAGTPNTGGGGGGKGTGTGGNGGSGTVIISYAGSQAFNGGLVTSSGGNTIHTFTSSGALTPLTNNLTNSLRFRQSVAGFLSRTPASATNRKTWTWSGWVKRGLLSYNYSVLFEASDGSGNNEAVIQFAATNTLSITSYIGAYQLQLSTTQVFRDPSAWYHIVVALDTTQATAANRCKVYINGSQVTAFSLATYPSQNYDGYINTTQNHYVGYERTTSESFDGYMADVNFIDGQALEPYYFGNNDANGVWKPILYKGTYGTNGFYLPFSDTSALTTSSNVGLGKDFSGNGNYWATNNISITAGTTYDAMTDVPTNTSATVANYCVINPLSIGSSVTITNGNLTFTNSAGTHRMIIGSMAVSSGKWYAEFTVTSLGDTYPQIGIVDVTQWSAATQTGANSRGWGYLSDGRIFNNNSAIDSGEPTYTNGDIIGVAFDLTNNKVYFSKNGTFINSADPAAGTNGYSITSGYDYAFSMSSFDTSTDPVYNLNFGQRPFSYTPPAGFVALNTFNLPTPTILQGNKYMDATLYTGTGSGSLTVTNAALFKPDLVWAKCRNTASQNHVLVDSVRGASIVLSSNLTDAEFAISSINPFNSNGFGVNGVVNNAYSQNVSGQTYVAWQWQAGQGSTSSNTSGSITSTVSVNTTAGFSVVTWTGSGSNSDQTIGTGLSTALDFIITKARDTGGGTDQWLTYTSAVTLNQNECFLLNSNAAKTTGAVSGTPTRAATAGQLKLWAGTTNNQNLNASGIRYVAYCWAAIPGFSAFGSYTGNGSTDGPFIATNFAPKFVLVKRTDSSTNGFWNVYDSARNGYNDDNDVLYPNSSSAEDSVQHIDLLSNGFKCRNATYPNTSGATYIYACFASNPFKNANAR